MKQLGTIRKKQQNCSYHPFAFIWASVLPSARTEQSDDAENLHALREGERSYGINCFLLIEAGRHPEELLSTDVWFTVSSQRINNKLPVHSFGLGFVSDCADVRLQVRVQASHCTGPHCVTRGVRASLPSSWQESPFPFRHARWDSAYLWNKWARSGKKLYLPVPDFIHPGWHLIWDCLSPFNFLSVFSQGDSTHITQSYLWPSLNF